MEWFGLMIISEVGVTKHIGAAVGKSVGAYILTGMLYRTPE
jgi:hypothetical protein